LSPAPHLEYALSRVSLNDEPRYTLPLAREALASGLAGAIKE
jgi:hypothetical protein